MFSSVTQSNRSTPDLPVHHQLLEFTQTHVHWVGDAIQQSHSLSSPSLPALNLSQHQSLFQGVSSSYQVAKRLEFQIEHQSFQWRFRTDFIRMTGCISLQFKGLDEHMFEEALGVGDGQGRLACCSPRGHKESDPTEWLNWLTDDIMYHITGLGKI